MSWAFHTKSLMESPKSSWIIRPVRGWFELAELITAVGNDPDTRVLILRADGRGFNAGVDIKEMQRTEGFDALLGANRGCWESFKAVYECKVPVITAVHGYCVGGGIGLAGLQQTGRRSGNS